MEILIAGIAIVVLATALIAAIAVGPLLAARRNPRPADQPAEMRRDEPASSSDDPGANR